MLFLLWTYWNNYSFILAPLSKVWMDIWNFIAKNVSKDLKLFWRDVLFGLFDFDKNKEKLN